MSSSQFGNAFDLITEDNPVVEKMNVMSPVTNLALNMKSLTTSLTGTPTRRISWSNPIPCDNNSRRYLEDLSPSTDSPTFQEISSRIKNKFKLQKATQKLLHSDNEEEKENVAPISNKTIDKIKKVSESVGMLECDSQDSGYSDMSVKHFEISSLGSTPRITVKSSMFTDEDEDGFESIFQMEEDDDDERELIPMPDMTNLLTKPLYNNIENKKSSDIFVKNGKLPIRRCLTMEMECSYESPPSKLELISQTGTIIASSSTQINTIADLEPPRRCPFKRPDPPSGLCFPPKSKRRKSSPSVHLSKDISPIENEFVFQRSFSETAATIMHAVQKADLQPELIGDCSRCYTLPVMKGRHQDLKCISPQTLEQLLKGAFSHVVDSYTLIDCRYPYEFEGGHIQGALNIYTKEDILEKFLARTSATSEKNILIFHCEFSSERAPSLLRFLRSKDREMNESSYPKLHHPEMYILEGGYKGFFEDFKEFCEPQDYKPMNHKDHGFELRRFRAKSKSWGAESKSRYKFKSSSLTKTETL